VCGLWRGRGGVRRVFAVLRNVPEGVDWREGKAGRGRNRGLLTLLQGVGRRVWLVKYESTSASTAILSISSYQLVYRDDVYCTHSLARRRLVALVTGVTGGRLDASTGWGGCVFIARPMESPRGSLSFASKGKR